MTRLRIFSILFFIISISYSTMGQGINNNWIMGYASYGGIPWGNTLIDYSAGSPVMTYDSLEMEFHQTHANISDSLGNLLFYTNGVYIADATHDTMQNGSGLNPSYYTSSFPDGLLLPQAALIIQKPASSNLYYLFHSTLDIYPASDPYPYHLYLTTIDMNGNGGLGSVIQKNLPIINDTLNVGKITATKHGNGRDWWVVCHRANSNMFYKLLVTPAGIADIDTQSIGAIRIDDAGQAKFSPNGLWFAYYHCPIGLDILTFDRCSGQFIDDYHDNLPGPNGINMGCEFSPYSDMLYVTNVTQVFQYSLGAANIIASKQIVANYDGFYDSLWVGGFFGTYLCQPQLAPDGKIYIATGNGTRYFHTIHYPYFPGVACNLVQHDLNVPALYYNTIPNHPNYFLGAKTGSPCDTLTSLHEDEPSEVKINAWPVPAHDNFTISFPAQSIEGKLKIFDISGKLVYDELIVPWSQLKKISINYFNPGIYLCRTQWKNKVGSVKLIKN